MIMTANNVLDHKESAVKFLELVVAGKIGEAYQKYVNMGGKHHNPFFPAGFPALKKAMIENHVQYPNKKLTLNLVLGDGDLVAVHSHIMLNVGDRGIAVVHMFRFEGNRVKEMWDCGQQLPAESLNTDGAF